MKRVLAVLMFVLSLSLNGWAGEGHNHEAAVEPAPHGGILRDAAPYKAELVLNGDQAKIYIYDKALKPASLSSKTMLGKIRLPKAKEETEITFAREKEYFAAALPGVSKVHRFDLHVYLEEAGKKTVLDFGIDNIH